MPKPKKLFTPFTVTITPEASQAMIDTAADAMQLMARHTTGDWGLHNGKEGGRVNDRNIKLLETGVLDIKSIRVVSMFQLWGGLRMSKRIVNVVTVNGETLIDVPRKVRGE